MQVIFNKTQDYINNKFLSKFSDYIFLKKPDQPFEIPKNYIKFIIKRRKPLFLNVLNIIFIDIHKKKKM